MVKAKAGTVRARRRLEDAIFEDALSKVPPTLDLGGFARLLGCTVEHVRRLVRERRVYVEHSASGIVIIPIAKNRGFLRGYRLRVPMPDRPEIEPSVRLLSVPVSTAAYEYFDSWSRERDLDHRRALERLFGALDGLLG